MRRVVFYSWQSDLPNATNRGFIEKALETAARSIRLDDSIEVEPVIDRDTAGVPGAPDISTTIFAKIDQADVFVCDVSIVNGGTDARLTPNPNVLLELGYAMKALGAGRIIMVLNAAWGGPESLPFDLRLRRVIRYDMPQEGADRAAERKRLEAVLTDSLRTILGGPGTPLPGEPVQPLSIREQTQAAIVASRPDRDALARRFMAWLAGGVSALAPTFTDDNRGRWFEIWAEAVTQTQDLVLEFGRLAEVIAAMNAVDAAHAVYKGFAAILELYNPQPGFSGSYFTIDFDIAKFVGHELFVTLFSFLIREARWELIADLLDEDIYVGNAYQGQPRAVPFTYISQQVQLLADYSRRSNRASLHADLLNERHTQGDLAQLVPMQQFVDADYFLALRAQLEQEDAPDTIEWPAWSILYLRQPPRYIVEAERTKSAERLLRPLGLADIATFRDRFVQRAPSLGRLFNYGIWLNPVTLSFDPQRIGSR